MGILVRLIAGAIALWIATGVFDGIYVDADSFAGKAVAIVAAAVIFGLVNAILRPVIKLVGGTLYLVTFGLIALVVNGLLFMLTSWISGELGLGFHVADFWPNAVLGALLVSVVSWLVELILSKVLDD